MATIDPNTPVIIGVAQTTVHRGQQPGPEPLLLWARSCRAAMVDAGLPKDGVSSIDVLALAHCLGWQYDDGGRRLAENLGADPTRRHDGAPSGTSGQTLLDKVADDIRAGRAEFGIVCGGESLATARHLARQGVTPDWSFPDPLAASHRFDLDAHQHPGEVAIGLTEGIGAVYGFAMRDIARRASLGMAPDDYRRQLGDLLSGMSRVAAANDDAWFGAAKDAAFIAEPRPDNRMIAYPYTKHMVAIIDVDIAAALIVTSEAKADALGIARDRRIYPWASRYAEDPVFIGVRDDLATSPAMRAAGKAALDAAGVTIDEVDHVDLYSCFAAAVNFARDALGIADRSGDRITVTGGLPYAGGPASSYMITSIAKMVGRLRAEPGSIGLVSGVGMMMSNHIFALYSSAPPRRAEVTADRGALQRELDAIPQRRIDGDYSGPATIAAYTVMHDRHGHISHGAAICDLPGGDRAYARILDRALLEEGELVELVGRTFMLTAGAGAGILARA